ncbi:Polycomb group RING finger protein 3 [Fukomys damarensis]|uniref:Polycomb group RING finger protein 3 n=1 Tax=Fukomys damarensis TaxID=885580 RepID=A0A091DXL0_FUKDA|nr:Polycomb group RING finger protein 3 [Fukomys damarensis]
MLCKTALGSPETKADDSSKKETAEEKQEEDNDYHRSDEHLCLECNSSKLRGLKRKWIHCSAQALCCTQRSSSLSSSNFQSFNELDNEDILGKEHTLKFVVVTPRRFKKPPPTRLHYRPRMDLL